MKNIFLTMFFLTSNIVFGQDVNNFNSNTLLYSGEEKHLSNVRQLTFGGDNAEAYFSF